MKTPREILLQRHRDRQSQLDRIRQNVLAKEFNTRRATAPTSIVHWVRVLWQQLILPCRRSWAVIAAAWVVIAALRVLTGAEPVPTATRTSSLDSAALQAKWRERLRLQSELLEITSEKVTEPRKTTLGPRSDTTPDSFPAVIQAAAHEHWMAAINPSSDLRFHTGLGIASTLSAPTLI